MTSSLAIRICVLMASVALVASACESFGIMNAAAQTQTAETPADCEDRAFDVYFDEWRAELTPDAREAIALVQREMHGCAIEHVRIVGLAGARGDEADNLSVSMARAEAIAAALQAGGWPAEHFELVALGEQGATVGDTARPMRRRAHIMVQAAPPSPS